MAGWVRRVGVVVVLTLLISGVELSPADIDLGNQQLALGEPIPDGVGGIENAADIATVNEPGEVVGRRTETSRTVVADDGTFQTTFFDHPVNFQDANGDWQAIDTSLTPGEVPGSLRAKAGPVEVSLPATMGSDPVRVAKGDTSVELSLRGASGARARTGLPRALGAPTGTAVESAATYRGALPGVDVAYTALPEGVKEEIVLSGPQSPASYDFDLRLSTGHSAEETAEGGVSIVDAEGTERATLAPPFVADASYSPDDQVGEQPGYSTEAVSLRIVERAPGWVLRLAVDSAWLAAPERTWPVVVDPTVTIPGATHDTYVASGAYANNIYGSSTALAIQGGSQRIRALHQRDVLSFFNEPAVITGATLELYATNDTSAATRASVGVYPLTSSWSSSSATWNNRMSGTRMGPVGTSFEALLRNAKAAVRWPTNAAGRTWSFAAEKLGGGMGFSCGNRTRCVSNSRLVVSICPGRDARKHDRM